MAQFTDEQLGAVRRAIRQAVELVGAGTPPAEAVELAVQEVAGEPADGVEAFLRARRVRDARLPNPLRVQG